MAPSVPKTTSQAAATSDKSKRSKRKLLDDSDSDSDDGGAAIESSGFKVNEEYARRFEYNKKRDERQKLEEKLKNQKGNGEDDEDSSSTDETEDEDGFLATEDLDAQISATLNAIRNKDPRVYDKSVKFYNGEDDADQQTTKEKKEKPVTLRDYHREKIMRGDVGASDDEEEVAPPPTYAQEQNALKDSLLNAAKEGDSSDEDEDDDGFMKRKEPAKTAANGVHPSRAKAIKVPELDVVNAEKDPETFLSNFMAARAWVTDEGSKWEAFESDDGEDDNRADEFEQAYNMRFEDPDKSNEVLKSYARDIAASKSVRREDKTGRKRQRELEKEKKEAEKRERREDKARLRKLKLEETEEKLRKIKHAAGASGREIEVEDWMKFLDDAWEDDRWEDEMKKRFGDEYYTVKEGEGVSDDEMDVDGEKKKKKSKNKIKKPTWDDDIDIKDLIPDFEDDDGAKPAAPVSDNEGEGKGEEEDNDEDEEEGMPPSKKRKASDHKRTRQETQKKARQERAQLEALVEAKLQLEDHDLLKANSSKTGGFRYRETSPQSFGMTARDILLAPSDKVLNEYAGLKKLATYRDAEKKKRDKKKLGKKARLRQWRRDVFGGEYERSGPTYGFEGVKLDDGDEGVQKEDERRRGSGKSKDKGKDKGKGLQKDAEAESSNIIGEVDGTRKKRKRSKGKKTGAAE
ncbi:Protein kri1 [Escovopsis weberi]|uniref:Protein kri1 n=1 Tax=Escovopsis weberi TaxID=150374 RepID=A0A0M9VU55_ESCWE|nr:Protein kri1 [Escovopsis weberi]